MFYFFSKMWKFEKVNIIPLIAKADTLTPDECDDFKREIIREIETHKINVYEFPDHDDEEDNKYVLFIIDRGGGLRTTLFFSKLSNFVVLKDSPRNFKFRPKKGCSQYNFQKGALFRFFFWFSEN